MFLHKTWYYQKGICGKNFAASAVDKTIKYAGKLLQLNATLIHEIIKVVVISNLHFMDIITAIIEIDTRLINLFPVMAF